MAAAAGWGVKYRPPTQMRPAAPASCAAGRVSTTSPSSMAHNASSRGAGRASRIKAA